MVEPLRGPVIVLDHPAHAGNVGAAARAMSNMGLGHLRLVAPRQFPHPEAVEFAVHGVGVLEQARVFDTLDEAVADLNLLVATTNRWRGQRNLILTPRQLGERMPELLAQPGSRVGILFGSERSGLETVAVERCDLLCNIPTQGNGSLNLAQAVMVVAYEMLQGQGRGDTIALDPHRQERPDQAQMERLFVHMEETLRDIGFIKDGQKRHMIGSLRAIFHRAGLDQRELAILRGIWSEVQAVRRRDRLAWERGAGHGASR